METMINDVSLNTAKPQSQDTRQGDAQIFLPKELHQNEISSPTIQAIPETMHFKLTFPP